MSSATAKRPATYEDLQRLPENVVGEIIDGELVVSPRPALRHAAAASALGGDLATTFGRHGGSGPGGWIILAEPEVHIVGQVLVPDLAGWRRERLPQLPDAAFLDVAPDWVCEVLSSSTVARDRTSKTRHYAGAGVGHLWFVDPSAETLEVYRLEAGAWRLVGGFAGAVKVRAEPFEGLELDLGNSWVR
jgi:Uma2 family endonuclease